MNARNSKQFDVSEIKELKTEMEAQMMILETENALKEKVAKGTATNDEKEALTMIRFKMALDANSVH